MHFVIFFLSVFLVNVNSFRDYPSNYVSPLDNGRHKCNRTVYEKSLKNVLTRKKRGFVFFKGTVVVLTDVMAKAILPTQPRGLIQSNEVDIFYDVPLLVEGWRQPFNDYVKNMKADAKKYEAEQKELNEDEKLKNVGVVNASAIPLDQYYKGEYARPAWSRYPAHYENYRKGGWSDNRRNYYVNYSKPFNRGSSKYYYPSSQRRNYVQSGTRNKNYYSSNRSYSSADYNRNNRLSYYNSANQNTQIKKVPSWHQHREYRERRDIYEHVDQFGKALGLKLRKCILRAICEMRENLLPDGQSFINDVARILFTVPTDHDDKDDEFTKMALEENVDCARRFMISCPHSPMQYFLNNFAAKDFKPAKEPTADDFMKRVIYA